MTSPPTRSPARSRYAATTGSTSPGHSRERRHAPAGRAAQAESAPADRAPSAASPDRIPTSATPQLLEATLGRLVGDYGWELDLRMRGSSPAGRSSCGDEVAGALHPRVVRSTARLVVRTDSTAWATQLRLLAPTVVRRLNEQLGHGTVALIEVLGPHLPTWKKGPRSARDGRGPRDTYG